MRALSSLTAPLTVIASFNVASVILSEASLSFLGLGVPVSVPTWGSMLADSRDQLMANKWWLALFPGMAIVLTVLSFNILGDWLRDFLDPRLKTTTLHELMFNAGRFGRKTGQGYHDYTPGIELAKRPGASANPPKLKATLVGDSAHWAAFSALVGLKSGDDVTLIAPIGEDCTTVCARLGLDPKSTVAIDFTALDRKHLTVMSAPGGGEAAAKVADWLRGLDLAVEVIQDSPGFVLQRILVMVANLGCELAQIGVGAPADIDTAMKLAQNYPAGPLEWAEKLGVANTFAIMEQLQKITGSDRYRPSLWLRRRAQLGLSVYTPA